MRLILVTGGARSGKSRHAERLAAGLGGTVAYVATARRSDEEMARRIARHRADRPAEWTTIEAPRDAGAAVRRVAARVVVVDCVTLLASNAFVPAARADGESAGRRAVNDEIDALLAARAARDGTLIAVTNEIGLGVVPSTRLGRWFRDALGAANQRLAAAADVVVLMVSGLAVGIKAGGRPPTHSSSVWTHPS